MEKTVEAVICGHEITSAEVDAFIASLPREQQVYASHPDFRKQCVDQLIAVYALAKYGEEEKLDETEKFKAILEMQEKISLHRWRSARFLRESQFQMKRSENILKQTKQDLQKEHLFMQNIFWLIPKTNVTNYLNPS